MERRAEVPGPAAGRARSASRVRCTDSWCWARDDAVLRPAILWNDQRTAAECEEIEARVGLDRLIELTGNRALTGFTAPKLLWLRRHEPETYAQIRHILLPKDYVRFRLTGERAIDAADASGTLLYRRRAQALVGRGLQRPGDPARMAAARVRVDRSGRRRRPGRGRAGRRDLQAGARLGRARHLGGRLRGACPSTRPIRRRACTSSATRCPAPGTRWA